MTAKPRLFQSLAQSDTSDIIGGKVCYRIRVLKSVIHLSAHFTFLSNFSFYNVFQFYKLSVSLESVASNEMIYSFSCNNGDEHIVDVAVLIC